MSGAVSLVLLWCLLQASLCEHWDVIMPLRVNGLSGSCVIIPCNFTLPPDHYNDLDDSCRAIWYSGSNRGTVPFISHLSEAKSRLNIIQGNLIGSLHKKDCTTIFHNLPSHYYTYYFLRLQCDNQLKYTFKKSVLISSQDSWPSLTRTPSLKYLEEGDPVRLSCSSVPSCPILPPILTWNPKIGDIEEVMETGTVTSVMTFNASHLHNKKSVSCTSVYRRQVGKGVHEIVRLFALHVKYAPKFTTVSYSGPVKEGSYVTLTCTTDANPAVSDYTWYRLKGDKVTVAAVKKEFSTRVSEVDNQFYCQVRNKYGDQKSPIIQIELLFSPKDIQVLVSPDGPVLENSSVSLACRSRANPPVTKFTWYKDGETCDETRDALVLNSVGLSHSGEYHCAASNDLGDAASAAIQLDIQYPPKNTSVSVEPSGPILNGSSVTLTCRSIANPPAVNFTWFRVAGGAKEMVGSEQDFVFNVTKLSEDLFYCDAANVHGSYFSEIARLDIRFAPEILPSSLCARSLSQIRCSCDSQGNPLPSVMWELIPYNSTDVTIREVSLGGVSTRSLITIDHVGKDVSSLLCLSNNSLGSDSFTFNISSSEAQGFHPMTIVLFFALGVLGMLLVCVPLLRFFRRKRRSSLSALKSLADPSHFSATNETNTSQVDVIYANDVNVEEEVDYTDVVFINLRAKSNELGEEETTEYSQIYLHARPSEGEDATEEGGCHSGQFKDSDVSSLNRQTRVRAQPDKTSGFFSKTLKPQLFGRFTGSTHCSLWNGSNA